ncbi:hypothetical protein EON68_00825 [archaeon]|nr:MAG: hypothetical protein EON68_00825 [archaeon]
MLRLQRYEGIPFAKLFPHVRGPCLDLLQRMLTFDPEKRISVDDALAHPFLARVRAARRPINEEGVPVPRPFKLRVPGGSSGLRTMSVEAIKARFFAELCGLATPTPTSAPKGVLFDVAALDALSSVGTAATAVAGPAPAASSSFPPDASMSEIAAGAAATGSAGATLADERPNDWSDSDDEDMHLYDEE